MKTKLLRGALLASLVAVPALVSGVAVEPAAATGTPAGDTALEVSVSRDGAVRETNLECHPRGLARHLDIAVSDGDDNALRFGPQPDQR